MYIRTIKCLLLLLLFAGTDCRAQIGVKLSQLSPYGDIGEYFNKAPSIEVYGVAKEDKWKERFGILYSHLTPRTDTVHIYAVQTDPAGNTQLVLPGYLVNHTLTYTYVTGDLSYRFVKLKGFSLYGGAGIVAGKSHTEYDKAIETVITEHDNIDVLIAGFKLCTNIEYQLSPHLHVYADYTYNGIVSTF